MMYSRSPFYYVNYVKFTNKKILEKNKEAYLFRIQYQTHRNMIADLKEIRKLRKEKDVKVLKNNSIYFLMLNYLRGLESHGVC